MNQTPHHMARMSQPVSTVLAIDPGNEQSAYTWIDEQRHPNIFEKLPNAELLRSLYGLRDGHIAWAPDVVAIEMVSSYGMPVGREVFETCVWIGRFIEAVAATRRREPLLVYRRDVKLHHCHSSKATDATVRQALVDRFATTARNHGKGTKAAPGWFYGFRADVWQAYALAVYVADTIPAIPTPPTVSVPVVGFLPGPVADTDQTPGASATWGSAQRRRDTTTVIGAGGLF